MSKSVWSEQEIEILKNNYETVKYPEMTKLLYPKTYNQIKDKAKTYNLRKKVSCSLQNMEYFENLDDKEVCYWWGFFTADGCFGGRSIIFSIDISDELHLRKLANRLNSNMQYVHQINDKNPNGHDMVRIAIEDIKILPRIVERFSLKKAKTYNPFNIDEFLTKERFVYFLAGWIDGDGCIKKNGHSLCITGHYNWKANFEKIQKTLKEFYNIKSIIYVINNKTSTNLLHFNISIRSDVKKLKELINNEVPYLTRKWDRII